MSDLLEHNERQPLDDAPHRADECTPDPCPFHNRSEHAFRAWPQWWHPLGYMERLCEHGLGHPDPDEPHKPHRHGCDGCCGEAEPDD